MAGQLDSLFKNVAKSVVATLGDSLDHTITYTKKGVSSYNVETGEDITVNTTYSDIKVPISFIRSEEEGAQEMREAKLYITPDLIGDNQPSLEDEITLSFAGSDRVVQIVDIDTKKGGQTYLFILWLLFPESDSRGFPLCGPFALAPPQVTRHMAKGVGGWVGRSPGTFRRAVPQRCSKTNNGTTSSVTNFGDFWPLRRRF